MEKPQNQAADVVSGEGSRLHIPRDGATHKEGDTALLCGPRRPARGTGVPGDTAPISPSISCRLTRGRLLQMAEEPPPGVTQGAVLALCHTTEGCYLQASHGELQKVGPVVWLFKTKRSSPGSMSLRPVPRS